MQPLKMTVFSVSSVSFCTPSCLTQHTVAQTGSLANCTTSITCAWSSEINAWLAVGNKQRIAAFQRQPLAAGHPQQRLSATDEVELGFPGTELKATPNGRPVSIRR
jgi:hypothetical protein